MARLHRLDRAFRSRYGVPVLSRVDESIFTERYFTHCLACRYCHDACCDHGVDVDLLHAEAIDRHATGLEAFTGISRDRWFHKRVERDGQLPGGGARRTRVRDGHCVFLNRGGRGCTIHAYCLERGIDYHELKSIIDCLFPLTYYDDVLCAAEEVEDRSLVCMDTGPTLYRGVREELLYYFGAACVGALDAVEATVTAALEPLRREA